MEDRLKPFVRSGLRSLPQSCASNSARARRMRSSVRSPFLASATNRRLHSLHHAFTEEPGSSFEKWRYRLGRVTPL